MGAREREESGDLQDSGLGLSADCKIFTGLGEEGKRWFGRKMS